MLRTRAETVSLWEAGLPPEVLRLPAELARVDALLDDSVFFAPFLPFFDPRVGRPSTPMETHLRMMFLKFRYRLGYESLCREVSDSINPASWVDCQTFRLAPGSVVDLQAEVEQPPQVQGSRPVVEPGFVLGHAAVAQPAVAFGGEPGDRAFDHRPVLAVVRLPGQQVG